MSEGRVATATVLFCDLVDSTAQRTALGDDAADRVAVSLDRLLRDTIDRHHGSVVKSTGDGVMAVFDAASDALNAAISMYQATERHNRTIDERERLVLRIGVSAGDVHFVAHDCHGTPVVEAARLESAAEPGTILVSELARLLAGNRGGHCFESVGPLDLKGFAHPIEAYRVVWEPSAETELDAPGPEPLVQVPLPDRFERRPVFVARTRESRALREALAATRTEATGRVVVVSGEPGIGKTSLASAFGREAREAGAVVLYGRCYEDRSVSYQPWVDALAHLCRHAPRELLRAHVAARGGELVRLVPDLAEPVELRERSAVDPETEQYLLFGAVDDLLGRVGASTPLVLVLDDLHWADASTLTLLRYLVASGRPAHTLVIAIYRDTDVTPEHPLADTLASLYREPGVSLLPIDGLDPDGLMALLEATAGHELEGDDSRVLRDRLLVETDGNPFFATETLRHLAETGAIARDPDGRWVTTTDLREVGLPVTVREVVRQRVARLGPDALRILGLASVIGREFDVDLLVAVADADESLVLDTLDAATAAAVVHAVPAHPERCAFAHALVGHTLSDGLSPARRLRAHRRVADALVALVGDDPAGRVGELANHWIAASPDSPEALDYAVMAGQHAMHRAAPQDAAFWFAQSLRLLDDRPDPDPQRRCLLLVELGIALREAGSGQYRERLLEASTLAVEIGSTNLLVRAVLANTRGWASSVGSVDRDRVAALEAALVAVGPDDSADRARLLATLAAETSYATGWQTRLGLSDEGLAIARRVGDDDALSYVLSRRAHSIWVPDTLAERLDNTAENLALTARSTNPVARFWAAFYRIAAVASQGERAEIPGLLDTLRATVIEVGSPLLRWEATTQEAWHALVGGHLDEAERLTFAAYEAGTASEQPDARIVFSAGAFLLRLEQGRLGEVVDAIADMARDTPGLPGLRGSLGIALCESGRVDEAQALLARELASGFAEVPYDQFWVVTLVQWALVVDHLREPRAAELIASLLTSWADQFAFTGVHCFGSVRHALAVGAGALSRYDEAEHHFMEALRGYDRFGAPAWAARLRLGWADTLIARGAPGDDARAASLAHEAGDVARRLGLSGIQRRSERLLLFGP